MIKIKRNAAYVQAAHARFCLHIGGTAILIGNRPHWTAHRLELFTDLHRFRFSRAHELAGRSRNP